VDAHFNLGIALGRLGRVDEASREFRRVLELAPQHSEAVYCLGLAAEGRGDWDQAAALYRRALQRPTDWSFRPLRQLGIVYVRQGHVAVGLPLLRRAAMIAPTEVPTRLTLVAVLLMQPGRDTEAAEQLREGLRYNPRDAQLLNALAWLLATSPEASVRRPDEAVSLAVRALAAGNGQDPSLLDTRAAAEAAAGRPGAAAGIARRALALAERAGADTLAASIRGRLAEYERGGAWIETGRAAVAAPGHP
jgi:tetratricopeptide (TPR) repeat protein